MVNRKGLENWDGTEETYIRDVVHRWLHRIEIQPAGTIAAYSGATWHYL